MATLRNRCRDRTCRAGGNGTCIPTIFPARSATIEAFMTTGGDFFSQIGCRRASARRGGYWRAATQPWEIFPGSAPNFPAIRWVGRCQERSNTPPGDQKTSCRATPLRCSVRIKESRCSAENTPCHWPRLRFPTATCRGNRSYFPRY